MAETPRRGYRAALRHRDFRVLMARYVTSGIGSWAYVVALIAFVYEQTNSPLWIAIASVARLGPMFLLGSYAGVLAERFERTRLMFVSDIGGLLSMLGLVIVALSDAPAAVAIALAAVASGMAIMEEPAVAALVPQVVGEDDLAAANALYRIIQDLNVIAGPALGAGLVLVASTAGTFAANAATFAVAALLVTRLRVRSTPTDVTEGGEAGLVTQLGVGLRAIAQSRSAVAIVTFSVLVEMLWGIDTVLFVVVGTALGLGSSGFGFLLTGLGIGGVVAALFVNRVAALPRLGSVIAVGMVAISLPTIALIFVDEPGIAFAFQVVRGAGVLVVDVVAVTALQRSLQSTLVARVFGAFLTLQIGMMVLGALATPFVLEWIGLDGTLLAVGVGALVVVAVWLPRLLALDRDAVRQLAHLAPRIQLLEGLGIFDRASRTVIERLAAAATDETADTGTVIIREGETADALYVLVAGEVAVSARGEAGSARRLATMTAPAYFGEIGLLAGIPRTATVKALQPSTLYRIDGDDFLDALTTTPVAPSFVESARAHLVRIQPSQAERAETLINSGSAPQEKVVP